MRIRFLKKLLPAACFLLACGSAGAEQEKKSVENIENEELVLEEVMVHLDRMFKDYLNTSRKDIEEVNKIIQEGDLDGIEEEVNKLAWQFEEIKRSLREESLTVSEILREK